MTLRELKLLLNALPEDAADLPVSVRLDLCILEATIIHLYPAANMAAIRPQVQLEAHPFGAHDIVPHIVEHPRRPARR